MKWARKQSGFTIVELLIVIVVIAILAAITIVGYNGIQNRARATAVQSDVSSAFKKIESFRVTSTTDSYPATLAEAGISTTGTILAYSPSNGVQKSFCLTGTNGSSNFYVSSGGSVKEGTCFDNEGLVAEWYLNGGLSDDSGNNFSLTQTNNPSLTTGANGAANSAYQFNTASSQYLSSNQAVQPLVNSNTMTITGWINPVVGSDHAHYFGFRNNSRNGLYMLQFINTNNVECRLLINGAVVGNTGIAITPNVWQMISITYDGSGVTCYRNGVAGTRSATAGQVITANEAFMIGSNFGSSSLTGRIDDVRVYNRALGASELDLMYKAGAR